MVPRCACNPNNLRNKNRWTRHLVILSYRISLRPQERLSQNTHESIIPTEQGTMNEYTQ